MLHELELDATDRRLLDHLQEHGRASNLQLAVSSLETLPVSSTTTSRKQAMKIQATRILALSAATLFFPVARAADTAPTMPTTRAATPAAAAAADKLGNARTLIAAKQWPAAIDELRRVNDTTSADWNNLMGYTLRKGKTPDLAASEKHYDEALRIDPHHRNTLEYSGELYLMKGELDKAQARLDVLSAECSATCEEYADLKSAIERYRAAGNQYVPEGW